nr:MAG TPA: hypothetical protein [Caudoviricetes sp.]
MQSFPMRGTWIEICLASFIFRVCRKRASHKRRSFARQPVV